MVETVILAVVITLILGGAALYIIKAKKRGDGCIGCPHSKNCRGKCNCK